MKRKKFIILPTVLVMLALWLPAQNPCSGIPGGLTVANQNITTGTDFKAQKKITAGAAVSITQAVDVKFIAQESITFTPGFTMVSGATLEAKLGDPCTSSSAELYPWVDGDTPGDGGQGESFPWVNAPEAIPWLDGSEANPWTDGEESGGNGKTEHNPWADSDVVVDDGDTEAFPWVDEPQANPWLDGGRLEGFPNPFVEETMLRFMLTSPETVALQVFNLKGELVARLYEGEVQAGQSVEVTFEGAEMPAGIYLARLTTASGKSATQRLMLQR